MVNQLILENLACQRGDKVLFHRVNLHIQAGDFVQIEGHNGIGKTSLLRIIAGLASPLEGEVRWNSDVIVKQREAFHSDLLYLGHQSGRICVFINKLPLVAKVMKYCGMCCKQWDYWGVKTFLRHSFQPGSKNALHWRVCGYQKHRYGF